jgi:hypothetical protein
MHSQRQVQRGRDAGRYPLQKPIERGGAPVTAPPVVPATGADAGAPGSFTPAGATVPANLAAMTGIVANPATAWTTGQHVVLGDASQAHWNATAWVAGVAP